MTSSPIYQLKNGAYVSQNTLNDICNYMNVKAEDISTLVPETDSKLFNIEPTTYEDWKYNDDI